MMSRPNRRQIFSFGVRPSPGEATQAVSPARGMVSPSELSHAAAPGDGRTPELSVQD